MAELGTGLNALDLEEHGKLKQFYSNFCTAFVLVALRAASDLLADGMQTS